MQPQAPCDDVAGQIRQPLVMSIRVGAQPDKCLRDTDAELLGKHPGGLIDLGAMQGQLRGLAAWAGTRRLCYDIVPGDILRLEQQQRRRIGEDQRIT